MVTVHFNHISVSSQSFGYLESFHLDYVVKVEACQDAGRCHVMLAALMACVGVIGRKCDSVLMPCSVQRRQ